MFERTFELHDVPPFIGKYPAQIAPQADHPSHVAGRWRAGEGHPMTPFHGSDEQTDRIPQLHRMERTSVTPDGAPTDQHPPPVISRSQSVPPSERHSIPRVRWT